ncbi:MAG: RluA family pseudouridine synthase [Acidobacteria bacterium]|nr:RluA family pseudouridine synthase [Acidobacteriota bacterium]
MNVVEQRLEIVVGPESHKKRLDEYLFGRFGGLSKMYLRGIVKDEKCEVNGRFENVGYRIKQNDFIEIELDLSRETAMRPQEMPLDIIYEDDDLIVVNKPAGMLVHPTNRDKSGTLLNALSFHLNREINGGESVRPGLIHRLDKQTSGLIVVSKTLKAHKKMMESFRRKFVEKRYVALVEGVIENDAGTIEAPIGRFGELKYWGVKEDGKPSETRYSVLKRNEGTTLLELEPVTGRTNQLRIHCEHIGHPIVGDVARGGREFERLCLHAYRLAFRHPRTMETVTFEAEPDCHFFETAG